MRSPFRKFSVGHSGLRRFFPLVVFLILSILILLLSALSNNLKSYVAVPGQQDRTLPKQEPHPLNGWMLSSPNRWIPEPGQLMFVVSPADPALYWRVLTADYYDGFQWLSTTRQSLTEELPKIEEVSIKQAFTVAYNTTKSEFFLPVPPSQAGLANPILSPPIDYELYSDDVADVYRIKIIEPSDEVRITYQATWHHAEIDKRLVSLDDTPQQIRDIYLQLPNLPSEVRELALELEYVPERNVVDQILRDVNYLLTHFEYDIDYLMGWSERTIGQDWVGSYLDRGKGVCLDAATALAVILRCQDIPSRLSVGFKPTKIIGDKIFYYSNTSHAETEVYLPPYGWVRFDATPPLESSVDDYGVIRPEPNLDLEIYPRELEGCPGENVFCHIMVNNSRVIKDHFGFSIDSQKKWNVEISSESLSVDAFETGSILMEVTIPDNAGFGEKDRILVTASSIYDSNVAVDDVAVVKVGNAKRARTVTNITHIEDFVFRGDRFQVEGTVSTVSNEPVQDMHVFILLKKNKEAEGVVCGHGYSQNGHFLIGGQVPYHVDIGDYAVVAVSLGNLEHAPSSSDPSIKVVARTLIELNLKRAQVNPEKPFLTGDYPIIWGRLALDNRTSLPNEIIELAISTPRSTKALKHKVLTGTHGLFMMRFEFWTPGIFELNATFPGEDYLYGSHVHRQIEVVTPTLHSFAGNTFIRGQVANISGKVSLGNIGLSGELVTLTLDGQVVGTVETGLNGSFTYALRISTDKELGWYPLDLTLKKREVSLRQSVKLMARSEITVAAPHTVQGGDTLTFMISLRDDHGLPVQEEEILVGDYGLQSKTDKNGRVRISLGTMPLWWENVSVRVSFRGSGRYLPSTTFVTVAVEPGVISLAFPLIALTLLVLGNETYRRFQGSESGKAQLERRSFPLRKEVATPTKTLALRIHFPEISDSFSNVWGVGEDLQIECELDEKGRRSPEQNAVEFFVNEERIAKDRLSEENRVTFSHAFTETGQYEVMATLIGESWRHSIKAEVKLRIVSYREELVRLYDVFLQHLIQHDVGLKESMTAREIERLLVGRDGFDSENLEIVRNCFEDAEYSDHPMNRRSYETMYLSLKELNVNVA